MKYLFTTLTLSVLTLMFLSSLATADEQRTNYYTQVTVYFAMNSLTEEYDATKYMQNHVFAQAWIKQVMERTDTTMNLQQRGFGPFPLADDPLRDSILKAEGQTGKRTLSYRAWAGMNAQLQDPQSPVYKKVQEIKDLTGAEVVTVVILTNSKYYTSHAQNNIPIMIITNNNGEYNHLDLHNQMIFDSTSTKAIGYVGKYPIDHPLYDTKEIETIFTWSPNIWIYPRKGLYFDKYKSWITVGDEDHNVLDPENGWKLDYLYNKGLLFY